MKETRNSENTSENSPDKWAKNKSQLALVLGITRPTLDAWIGLPEAPKRRADGRYEVAAWLSFKSSRKVETDANEAVALKLRNLKQKVELDDLKILREANDLMPAEWTMGLIDHLAVIIRNIIKESAISDEEKENLVTKIEAISFEDYISQLRTPIAEPVAGPAQQLPAKVEASPSA